ncbi:MAG: transposase [Acidobacteriota bacterium]
MAISNVAQIASVSRDTAYRWQHRTAAFFARFDDQRPVGAELTAVLEMALNDEPRPGAPIIYLPEEQCALVSIALEPPKNCGRPIEEWTHRELADEANKRQIFAPATASDKRLAAGQKIISTRTVGRILDEAKLKPHRIKYWENPKIDDPEAHQQRIDEINKAYQLAARDPAIRVISIDEKTGIQALERLYPDKLRLPGMPALLEFEYRRHGTLALIPSFDVATGKIITAHIGPTRTEDDFCRQIAATLDTTDPASNIIFVADQLNTHKSASLVRMIAERIDDSGDLGVKGESGILMSLQSRQHYLEDPAHRVRFLFTPKHCSWMNQIEIWFSILSRKALRRASFSSLVELQARIESFIEYFNRTMARPFNWTYTGRILQ